MPQHPLISELLRKLLHLSSAWIPLLYAMVDLHLFTNILMPITAVVCTLDGMRVRFPSMRRFLEETLRLKHLFRSHESEGKLSGASYFLLSALMVSLMFPKAIALAALWTLILADTAASLIGKCYGKHPLLEKSVEGTFAFFLTTWLVILTIGTITGGLENLWLGGCLVAIVASVAELLAPRLRIDDNLLIPFITAFFLMPLLPSA